MLPQRPGSAGAQGRLELVYVGADAELVPAAALQAMAGAGTTFIAADVPAPIAQAISAALRDSADAAPPTLRAFDGADPSLPLTAAQAGVVTVVIAGPHGAALARELAQRAAAAGLAVDTVPARPLFDDCLVAQELISLQRVTHILRRECPWDRVQTAQDIVSYSLEEVYELADAIGRGEVEEEHDELGDVLFQVYFLSLLLEERAAGDLGTVAAAIERKLVRRHAHIFADAVAETPAQVRGQWERIKREQEGRQGVFHDVPGTLPALLLARKLQRRAAEVGFDWQTAHQAFPKIAEEHAELAEALSAHGPLGEFDDPGVAGGRPAADSDAASAAKRELRYDPWVRHELGDLLFAVVNVARKAGVDPELALREAAQRFEQRVSAAAALADAEGHDWTALGLDEQERYYQRAKASIG